MFNAHLEQKKFELKSFQSKNVKISIYCATLNQVSEAAIVVMDFIRSALESWESELSNALRMVIVRILWASKRLTQTCHFLVCNFWEIDTNNGGIVLFEEFCEWAMKKGLDYDTSLAGGDAKVRGAL